MRVYTTPKYFAFRFANYFGRPAVVYVDKGQFTRTAARYGWGDACAPTDVVANCAGLVPLGEVLFDALTPVRVRY